MRRHRLNRYVSRSPASDRFPVSPSQCRRGHRLGERCAVLEAQVSQGPTAGPSNARGLRTERVRCRSLVPHGHAGTRAATRCASSQNRLSADRVFAHRECTVRGPPPAMADSIAPRTSSARWRQLRPALRSREAARDTGKPDRRALQRVGADVRRCPRYAGCPAAPRASPGAVRAATASRVPCSISRVPTGRNPDRARGRNIRCPPAAARSRSRTPTLRPGACVDPAASADCLMRCPARTSGTSLSSETASPAAADRYGQSLTDQLVPPGSMRAVAVRSVRPPADRPLSGCRNDPFHEPLQRKDAAAQTTHRWMEAAPERAAHVGDQHAESRRRDPFNPCVSYSPYAR